MSRHDTPTEKHSRNPLFRLLACDLLDAFILTLSIHPELAHVKDKKDQSILHWAVKKNRTEIVELLCRFNVDINAQTRQGLTALHLAAMQGNEDIFKSLIKCGANVETTANNGNTLLYFSILGKSNLIVKMILKSKPNLNDSANKRALRRAIIDEHSEIVDLLLDYGFEINGSSHNDKKLLYAIVANGYKRILEHLLRHGTRVDLERNFLKKSLLHTAVDHKQTEIVSVLLRHGANINAKDTYGRTPLTYALNTRNFDIATLLIGSKSKIKRKTDQLIRSLDIKNKQLTEDKELEIIEFALKHNFDLNQISRKGELLLQGLIRRNRLVVIETLLGRFDLTTRVKNGLQPMHLVALESNLELMELFNQKQIDLNAPDRCGMTPLHCAISCGNTEAVKKLFKFGADINLPDCKGNTPMHAAVHRGDISMADILLQNGAKVNEKNKNGSTPLHIAVYKELVDLTNLLLHYDADPNSQDNQGYTPLHYACNQPSIAIDILLHYGANINITSKSGHSPIDVVCSDRLTIGKRSKLNSYISDFEVYFAEFDVIEPNDFDMYGYFLSTAQRRKGLHAIKTQIVKLKCANFPVSDYNRRCVAGKLQSYEAQCHKEWEQLHRTIFCKHLTYFNIMTEPMNKLAKNRTIEWIIPTSMKQQFPIYIGLIMRKVKQIRVRSMLYENARLNLQIVLPNLPQLIIDEILSYFSNYDLKVIVGMKNVVPIHFIVNH